MEVKGSSHGKIAEADFLDGPAIGEGGDLFNAEPHRGNAGEDADRCRKHTLTAEAFLGSQRNLEIPGSWQAVSENGRFQSDDGASFSNSCRHFR
jgi:hypothetical protein